MTACLKLLLYENVAHRLESHESTLICWSWWSLLLFNKSQEKTKLIICQFLSPQLTHSLSYFPVFSYPVVDRSATFKPQWALWPVCGYAASCDALGALTPDNHIQQYIFLQSVFWYFFCGIEADELCASVNLRHLETHQSSFFGPILGTNHRVQFASCQSRSRPHPVFPLQTHQFRLTVHLLPNIS